MCWFADWVSSGICYYVLSVNVWLQCRILDFANGTAVRQLLALLQHLEYVTGKMLLQRTEYMKFIRCQVRTVKWVFETLLSTLLQQGCHLSGHVRFGIEWLSSFSNSEEASWWSQIIIWSGGSRSCLSMVLFIMPRILCWRHSYSHNTL